MPPSRAAAATSWFFLGPKSPEKERWAEWVQKQAGAAPYIQPECLGIDLISPRMSPIILIPNGKFPDKIVPAPEPCSKKFPARVELSSETTFQDGREPAERASRRGVEAHFLNHSMRQNSTRWIFRQGWSSVHLGLNGCQRSSGHPVGPTAGVLGEQLPT